MSKPKETTKELMNAIVALFDKPDREQKIDAIVKTLKVSPHSARVALYYLTHGRSRRLTMVFKGRGRGTAYRLYQKGDKPPRKYRSHKKTARHAVKRRAVTKLAKREQKYHALTKDQKLDVLSRRLVDIRKQIDALGDERRAIIDAMAEALAKKVQGAK